MKKIWVVIVGTIFGEKTIYGPFEDLDYLYQWVSVNCPNEHYEIQQLITV